MTKVSLRVYNHEIEGMIEATRLDEAIAHCQHILKTFPMYVETYRLLGKTFLEARKYADAADIFQRVLMAVPDDFVSHVGMSIIRDDEGKLDDAIWHMERAFEVQPSNSAIQAELRRLYGRRDGVEPPKIRLSRDALANMYSQGELFNQAIAEIRSVLADDPNRPDLQAMLARANYRAGQKIEAAEMAAGLLKKYPYCMDALRVLVDVLPGTARNENTQIYSHRLSMLDPYTGFATDSVFASDQVADSAVTLERLEYKPGAATASAQPDWASSLGIQIAGEKRAETTPAWMASRGGTEAVTPPPSEPSAAGTAAGDDALPDWMRSAGWQESTGTNPESPVASSLEPTSEPIAQANIPDWLKSMAPEGANEAENTPAEASVEPPSGSEEDVPDWLKSMAPTSTGTEAIKSEPVPAETTPTNAEIEPTDEGALPDWLKSMAPTAGSTETIKTEPTPGETPLMNAEIEPTNEEALPDWLKSLAPTASDTETTKGEPAPVAEPPSTNVEPEQAEGRAIPDWMQAMAPDAPGTDKTQTGPASAAETSPVNIEPEPAQEGVIPDWLQAMAPATTEVENIPQESNPAEAPPTNLEPEPAAEGTIPDWIQSMAPTPSGTGNIQAEPAAAAETPPTNSEPGPTQDGAVPDWLQSKVPPAAEAGNILQEPNPAETPPTNVEPEPAQEGVVPDWLRSMAPTAADAENNQAEPAAGTPPTNIEPEPAQEWAIPDWLQSMPPASAEMENVPQEFTPDESPLSNVEPEPAQEGVVPDWLQSMAPEQADSEKINTKPAPIETPATESESEPAFPDWLKSMAPEEAPTMENAGTMPSPVANPPANIEPEPAEEGPFPDWLKSLTPAAAIDTENSETKPSPVVSLPINIEPIAVDLADTQPTAHVAYPEEIKPEPEPVEEGKIPDWLPSPIESAETEKAVGFDAQVSEVSQITEPPTAVQPAAIEALPVPPPPASQESAPSTSPAIVSDSQPFQPIGEAKPLEIGDDAFGWLESLAAKQGANPDELLTKPQDRSVEMPDWLQHPVEEPKTAPEETPIAAAPEAIESEPVPSEEDITITTWLNTLDIPEAATEIPSMPPVQQDFQASNEDLPDWLKDLERPLASEPVKAETPAADIPDWLRQPAEPVSQEQTQPPSAMEPVSENTPEPDIPAWMAEPEVTAAPAVPTAPEEWIPADKPAAAMDVKPTPEKPPVAKPVPLPVETPAQREIIKGTGMLAHIPFLNKDSDSLTAAQTALDNNSLNEAMKEYAKLIKKGRLLEEVIHDLREAIYRFPVDEIVWQTLGDAYMRANRLQDALDAYTKAEELLR